MRKNLRNAFLAGISFLFLSYIYPGFKFDNSQIIIFSALGFSVLYLFLRPILKLLSLPLNLITFGLYSFFVNVIILYVLTYILNGFQIIAFQFNGTSFSGFAIPSFYVSTFFSALLASLILSAVTGILSWVFG